MSWPLSAKVAVRGLLLLGLATVLVMPTAPRARGEAEAPVDLPKVKDLKGRPLSLDAPKGGVSVVVEGLNIAKRHTKPRQTTSSTDRMPKMQQGGILEIAQPIPLGKVMVVCSSCGKPTRISHATLDNGRRVRVCRHCGEQLEVKS